MQSFGAILLGSPSHKLCIVHILSRVALMYYREMKGYAWT